MLLDTIHDSPELQNTLRQLRINAEGTVEMPRAMIDTTVAAGVAGDAKPPIDTHASRADNLTSRLAHMANSGGGVSALDLERYMGNNDLVRINYLERGMLAAKTVCRIYIADEFGAAGDWGTGFLVGPRLLMTNNHVLKSVDAAQRSFAEFGYEADLQGIIQQGKRFHFAPERAFVTVDETDLDFTLIALNDISDDGVTPLSNYGFLRLNPDTHKVEEQEFVTIIQHPSGEEKSIALRENRVVKIGDAVGTSADNFIWYVSDTAPGSSGAPAFNDQWQVVGVHHRGVPETRIEEGVVQVQMTDGTWLPKEQMSRTIDSKIAWIANEGVRISRIVVRIGQMQNDAATVKSPLVTDFLDDANGIRSYPGTPPRESIVRMIPSVLPNAVVTVAPTIIIGGEKASASRIHPLSYYDGRMGYDEKFLTGTVIPLPEITPAALQFGAVVPVTGTTDSILRYTHFSLVFCDKRKLPFVTAVNIDGKGWDNIKRGRDVWFYDGRVPLEMQIGESMYNNEPSGDANHGWFDRGHLVRRADPDWGDLATAAQADEDTFHFTNCSPQYWGFNEGKQLWQGLENYILDTLSGKRDGQQSKGTVFTGPLFDANDEEHRGVQIPQYFWKVVVAQDTDGKIYSSAYVVSQKEYATNIPFETLPVGKVFDFQVPLAKLEARTGLRFTDEVRNADVLAGKQDTPLRSLVDIAAIPTG